MRLGRRWRRPLRSSATETPLELARATSARCFVWRGGGRGPTALHPWPTVGVACLPWPATARARSAAQSTARPTMRRQSPRRMSRRVSTSPPCRLPSKTNRRQPSHQSTSSCRRTW
eukprot:2348176-Prymnesium_polylepis.1